MSEVHYSGNWYEVTEAEVLDVIEEGATRARQLPERSSAEAEWSDAPTLEPVTGAEPLIGIEGTLADFWQFAMGDLRTNNVRGYFGLS